MARTSENGDGGQDQGQDQAAATFGAHWTDRGSADPVAINPLTIKQELLVDLDRSPEVSISIGGKEWPFASSDSGTELIRGDEVIQGTVLFGSNITDSANKQKIEKILEQSTSSSSKKVVTAILHDIGKLTDMERLFLYFKLPLTRSTETDPLRMPLNPLGSRPEIMQTVVWIQTHLEEDADISLPKHEVYEEYIGYCTENNVKPLSTADFGKVMKQVFPNVRPRRLGTRGHSRYCYSGLRKKEELEPPVLADLFCDDEPLTGSGRRVAEDEAHASACALVKDWAEKLLSINVSGMAQLANYLVDKLYVDLRSKSASLWSALRPHQQDTDESGGSGSGSASHSTDAGLNRSDMDPTDHDKEHHMRELKRKLQEQHNLLNRRQSVQNRHSKKTKVAAAVSAVVTEGSTCSNGSSTSVNATANCAAALGPVDSAEVAATNLPASSVSKDRGDIKCSKNKSSARAKRKHKSNCGTGTADEASRTTAVQDSAEEDSCGLKTSGSKVAIPRLPHSRSPRPTSSSSSATASGGLVLVPGHSASNSPTAAMGSKPKFVPIQPKPSENKGTLLESGGLSGLLPLLKEEEDTAVSVEASAPLADPWEGGLHDEELANYWAPAAGDNSADCLSPDPQGTGLHHSDGQTDAQTLAQTQASQQLSQLRVLLEQNEELFAPKKKSAAGLLERRNVRFESPLTDQVGALLNNGSVSATGAATSATNAGAATASGGGGQNNAGGVPASPNTRRRAFNFTPISPRLTPDVPPSPGVCSVPGGCPAGGAGGQLRQLLSSNGNTTSPFVSPRQTPVPSSLPPSQPHSRHNSGHQAIGEQVTLDTPTSMVTEVSSGASNASDSAFVSPLNTPLSVSRSRHNSASNLLVNRVRHSSGASITVRHMPYATASLSHGPDGVLLHHGLHHGHQAAARSRHSSAGSPSLPRSAPLSPLVQSNFSQQQCDSVFGSERLRQDLRRRHVSAGMVLGLSRQSSVGAGGLLRAQTTLNSAMPSWGNDPLEQEIEGLLDSAPSVVNSVESVFNRSQSVPLSQMLQQQLGPGSSQSFSSLSQPTTPFGMGKPFVFSASAASSPYSYAATPVPSEWNDFNSHANSMDSGAEAFGSLDEIISEVYANNREELAPCLDGLGAEVMQSASTSSTVDYNPLNALELQGSGTVLASVDSDPSLSCSDTGDGFSVSELSDTVQMSNLMGAEDLAAALVALKGAPELNRLVQDVVADSSAVGTRSTRNVMMN